LIKLQIKAFPLFFTSPYFSIYTLNKTFSLERKKAQNGGENLSQKLGGTSAQTGVGKLHPILMPDLGG